MGGGAAILGGGWTALVAITAMRHARQTNQATINAAAQNAARALDAARAERIWEKRAEAYVDALYVVRHRQERRSDAARTFRFDQATEEGRQEWLASWKLPDEVGVEMRLLACASEQVLAASRAAEAANGSAETAYLDWGTLSDLARQSLPDSPVHDEAIAARKAIRSAVDEATKADEALLDAIRADLHSRPSQGTSLPPGDAEGDLSSLSEG